MVASYRGYSGPLATVVIKEMSHGGPERAVLADLGHLYKNT